MNPCISARTRVGKSHLICKGGTNEEVAKQKEKAARLPMPPMTTLPAPGRAVSPALPLWFILPHKAALADHPAFPRRESERIAPLNHRVKIEQSHIDRAHLGAPLVKVIAVKRPVRVHLHRSN